jgi:hypothetical protein
MSVGDIARVFASSNTVLKHVRSIPLILREIAIPFHPKIFENSSTEIPFTLMYSEMNTEGESAGVKFLGSDEQNSTSLELSHTRQSSRLLNLFPLGRSAIR